MAIYLLLLVIAFILLNKSKYGRKVILSGTNPRAAEYSGINTRFTIMSRADDDGLAVGAEYAIAHDNLSTVHEVLIGAVR